MLVKSKYNKQCYEDEFCVYKAKRKFISQHLLNTSQVYAKSFKKPHTKSFKKPHTPLNLLPDRAQRRKPMYKCWRLGIEIWPASLLPRPRCTRWRKVGNGSRRSRLLNGLSSVCLCLSPHTHTFKNTSYQIRNTEKYAGSKCTAWWIYTKSAFSGNYHPDPELPVPKSPFLSPHQ